MNITNKEKVLKALMGVLLSEAGINEPSTAQMKEQLIEVFTGHDFKIDGSDETYTGTKQARLGVSAQGTHFSQYRLVKTFLQQIDAATQHDCIHLGSLFALKVLTQTKYYLVVPDGIHVKTVTGPFEELASVTFLPVTNPMVIAAEKKKVNESFVFSKKTYLITQIA